MAAKLNLVSNARGVHLERAMGAEPGGADRQRARSDAMRSHSVQYDNPGLSELCRGFVAAWNAHDAAALARHWIAGGDILSAANEKAQGRADIEAMFAPDFAEGGALARSTYRAKVSSVRALRDDLALVDWSTTVQGVEGPQGVQAPSSCSVASICELHNGKWRLVSVRPQG